MIRNGLEVVYLQFTLITFINKPHEIIESLTLIKYYYHFYIICYIQNGQIKQSVINADVITTEKCPDPNVFTQTMNPPPLIPYKGGDKG